MYNFNGKTEIFQTFAAGSVNGVYPRPVTHSSVLDLANAELENKAKYVNIILSNSFKATGKDGDCEYVKASIGDMTENDFRAVGKQCESNLESGEVEFVVCKRYSHYPVYKASAKSVTDLVVKMASDGVRGTVTVTFLDYPNGPRRHCEVSNTVKVVL